MKKNADLMRCHCEVAKQPALRNKKFLIHSELLNSRTPELPLLKDYIASASHPLASGFTLIELLVVVAIIGILAAIATRGIVGTIETARSVACKNNLRNMIQAAHAYASDHRGEMPPATVSDGASFEAMKTWEDFLWGYDTRSEKAASHQRVHQCPSLRGAKNISAGFADERYTGYNYNSSYVGGSRFIDDGVITSSSTRSASLDSITAPDTCAVFGDGEFETGANKFMRSPNKGPLDGGLDSGTRIAGAQGFRHRGKTTNVAYADGTVRSVDTCFTTSGRHTADPGCGFLSSDNSAYSLDGAAK